MRILEVRDGFIKLEASQSVTLASFIKIDDIEKSYIAQIIQLKRSGENSIAYAKILFLYDGALADYDKTLPSGDAQITEFTSDFLTLNTKIKQPILVGKTLEQDLKLKIDSSAFNKKLLVSVDDKASNNILVRNFAKQFNHFDKNVVIIDTLGVVEAKKYVAGVDFKLPLDEASLAFMYEDCLNDATSDSKATIIEIFKDLAEYAKTIPFVPFETLKSIVDEMVDKSHVFKLLVLKNKLAKFDRLGYFAKNKNEVDSLKNILKSKCVIIDISKLDSAFQNRYLSYIYEALNETNSQVILELSNVVNKKNLKNILSISEVATTVVTHSKYQYINEIKNIFDNFIIVPSFANNKVFDVYNTLLNVMPSNTYLLTGESTNYIPLISVIKPIDEVLGKEKDAELEELLNENNETEPQDEILANISEKADTVIAQVAEEIETPETIDLFNDESEDEEEDVPTFLAEESLETVELTEEMLEEPVEEKEDEEIHSVNSFETEVHLNQELTEYSLKSEENTEEIHGEDIIVEVSENISIMDDVEEVQDLEVNEILEPEIVESVLDENQNNKEYEEIQEYQEDFQYQNSDLNSANDVIQDVEQNDTELISLENDENLEIEETPVIIDSDVDLDIEENEAPSFELPEEEIQLGSIENNLVAEPELEVLPLSDSLQEEELGLEEFVELNPDDIDDNDILVEIEENEPSENIDEEIVKDVDKVFTTRKDDDFSDADLDLIDELNSDDCDELLEEISQEEAVLEEYSEEDNNGILEEQENIQLASQDEGDMDILETRSSSTPIVPVYDAEIPQEDIVMSDPIEQGDVVIHAKYGNGVVEKMIKYGNKTLFSINFDNVGRRLLDPTLTEIKKG